MAGISNGSRRPLSVWELPKLLEPVHKFRAGRSSNAKKRPHFARVLAFVHRNRYATTDQIQRRFSSELRSDRTARRHLAEMQALGWLDIAEAVNASPLWPKVYFVTRCGLHVLRSKFKQNGQEWAPTAFDRRRSEGNSASHILHELSITEFLLMVWETAQARADFEVLDMERRSLAVHPSFEFGMAGRRARLQPDAMFLFRARGKGMMCCFLEIDMGTSHQRHITEKLRRYEAWSGSRQGRDYLIRMYREHGAENAQPMFRILTVSCGLHAQLDERRRQVIEWCIEGTGFPLRRLWFSSADELKSRAVDLATWQRGDRMRVRLVG